MASDQDKQDDFDADQHFDDAELEAMLEHFEHEFQDDASSQDAAEAADAAPPSGEDPTQGQSFEDELEGLLGDKAKVALICTRLASGELLAAFCQITDISADCVGTPQGAVAILHNLDGDGPEAAAKDLTKVVSGLSALLAVNRADKLELTVYYQGEAGEQLPPPFAFPALAPFVEDVMLGITDVDAITQEQDEVITSDALDRDKALEIIARHTRYDHGSGSIE